jgi:hypothetical protein
MNVSERGALTSSTAMWAGSITVALVIMVVGVIADWGPLAVIGAVVGALGAVGALIAGIARRDGVGALCAVAAVVAGYGFVSWFFLDGSAINIGGLAAMIVGVLLLWVTVLAERPTKRTAA